MKTTELAKANLTAAQKVEIKNLKRKAGSLEASDYAVEARPAGCKGVYRFIDEADRDAVSKEIRP